MKIPRFVMPVSAIGIAAALYMAVALSAEPPAASSGNSEAKVADEGRVPLAVARDRAKLMYDIYIATLDVMHHRYFHHERAVIPARAMEDVFEEMNRQSKVKARWIAVNLKAMSIDHEPETDFEKKAAQGIAAGKLEHEIVEGGYYRRAGAVLLTGGCVSCHGGFFREASKSPKYAGLVISIPVTADSDGK